MTLLDAKTWEGRILLGEWTSGSGGEQAIVEPATGHTLGKIGLANPDDVRNAARQAAAAQKQWAATPPSERASVLRRAGELFHEHAEEIEGWIIREAGSIPPKAGLETHIAS